MCTALQRAAPRLIWEAYRCLCAGPHPSSPYNGAEFTATAAREWLSRLGVRTLYVEPGSPWENGYLESLNGKLRDELLDREIFDTLMEAKVLAEQWRRHYNGVRPHSALGYRAPAPEAIQPAGPGSGALRQPLLAGARLT